MGNFPNKKYTVRKESKVAKLNNIFVNNGGIEKNCQEKEKKVKGIEFFFFKG